MSALSYAEPIVISSSAIVDVTDTGNMTIRVQTLVDGRVVDTVDTPVSAERSLSFARLIIERQGASSP